MRLEARELVLRVAPGNGRYRAHQHASSKQGHTETQAARCALLKGTAADWNALLSAQEGRGLLLLEIDNSFFQRRSVGQDMGQRILLAEPNLAEGLVSPLGRERISTADHGKRLFAGALSRTHGHGSNRLHPRQAQTGLPE